jgi:hypothetical protein
MNWLVLIDQVTFANPTESLPPFLAAAAEGDVESLKRYIGKYDIDYLITCRDRNGSTAEHWAAGGGHVIIS